MTDSKASRARFPFSAVVGQDDAKLALQLAAVDGRIGGVLLRGETGSAKTTLARGLAGLLADGAPFVDLPLGATEDRVVGSLDLGGVLADGVARLRPGLLAQVHGGVLYVDEINLLADHLVDTLLDVAVSGVNIIERDGISERHPSRFVLVGSMNPEEGELRPQLLDRFGLCVSLCAPVDVADRVRAVRRRLDHDGGEVGAGDDAAAARLAQARPARLDDRLLSAASQLAVAVGAAGLRADLALCRAAAARAGLEGRSETSEEDLRRVAPLVLAHRGRRSPFDPPTLPPGAIDDALRQALGDPPTPAPSPPPDRAPEPGRPDRPPAGPTRPLPLGAPRRPPIVRPAMVAGGRGRLVRDIPAADDPGLPVAVVASVREMVRHRDGPETADTHLRAAVRETKAGRLLVVAVDLSGSMGAPQRAAAASGTVLGLLRQTYQRRDQVALVGFRGDGAEVLLAPTTSMEVARNRLGQLATGGATPLAEGIRTALEVATRRPASTVVPVIVLLTDGRATGRPGALDAALAASAAVRAAGVRALILDCETGHPRLGLADRLAVAMDADCVATDSLDPQTVTSLIGTSIIGTSIIGRGTAGS